MPPQQQYVQPSQQQEQQQTNATVWHVTWQSERDTPLSRAMIQSIVQLLEEDKQGQNTEESIPNFLHWAKRLEVSIYRDAQSFEAYTDMRTLKQRLEQIGVEFSQETGSHGVPRNMMSPKFPQLLMFVALMILVILFLARRIRSDRKKFIS